MTTDNLASFNRRLRVLEDREAIRDLIASYGPLADTGNAPAIAALWTDEGVYEVVGFAQARGYDAITALIEGPVHQALLTAGCAHVLGPVAVTLEGDRATARGHSVVFRNGADGFEADRVSANRWTLVRTAGGEYGGWRVVHRTNALLDGNAAARILLAPLADHPAS